VVEQKVCTSKVTADNVFIVTRYSSLRETIYPIGKKRKYALKAISFMRSIKSSLKLFLRLCVNWIFLLSHDRLVSAIMY